MNLKKQNLWNKFATHVISANNCIEVYQQEHKEKRSIALKLKQYLCKMHAIIITCHYSKALIGVCCI